MSKGVSRETFHPRAAHLPSTSCVYSFAPGHPPAIEVSDGDVLPIETADCFSGQITDGGTLVPDIDRTRANPATGPVFVRGCSPGDTLAVDILDLQPNRVGLTVAAPGMGLLGDIVGQSRTLMARVENDVVRVAQLVLPLRPMLGVIGVAPQTGSVSTVAPGPHGGNLDALSAGTGSTVYLPVAHPGALFAAGDMHAAMGNGEVSGTGIEVGGTATVRLRVLHELPVSWPWLETHDTWGVLVSGGDLREISRLATQEMVCFLSSRLGCDFLDAYMICGSAMNLAFCQVVNPLYTVRAELSKAITG